MPRANGGTDDDDNLIVMSRKEHSALEARLRGRGVKIST
ncbi:MAG: HNH endonuclease [Anaerolineales bacterium]|nr:HNH endonuclease [Anaerolineales bacterium]